MADTPPSPITVRPIGPGDAALRSRLVGRLLPGPTVSPRDPALMHAFFSRLSRRETESHPDAEAYVAELSSVGVALLVLHRERDPFTAHFRAYIDMLVVEMAAEGRGVGKSLLRFAEAWARDHQCREVCLDVFAGNVGAIAFYQATGYQIDHIRFARAIEGPEPDRVRPVGQLMPATAPAPKASHSGQVRCSRPLHPACPEHRESWPSTVPVASLISK